MVDLPVDQNGWIMLLTILLIFPIESGGFEQIRGKVRIQIRNEKQKRPTQKIVATLPSLRVSFSAFLLLIK